MSLKATYRYLTKKELEDIAHAKEELKVTCKHCGRRKVIPVYVDRLICNWCGHWIYRTPKIEFEYKLEKELKKDAKNI